MSKIRIRPVDKRKSVCVSVYIPPEIREDIIQIGGGKFSAGIKQVLLTFEKEIKEAADQARKTA